MHCIEDLQPFKWDYIYKIYQNGEFLQTAGHYYYESIGIDKTKYIP